jgi:hypothetical protein
VLAIEAADRERLHAPGVLERLLASGTKVELGPSAAQDVTLAPVDPAR